MASEPTQTHGAPVTVPDYLTAAYTWAYVTPQAVRTFERQWLVNLILWGNYRRLREAALTALGDQLGGRSLQVACVYGDLTRCWLNRHSAEGRLDVVDVLPVQLQNLAGKLGYEPRVSLALGDSTVLLAEAGTYDRALVFFLLHEQPEVVRRATVAEALRVVRPGGQVVFVDYHRPAWWHPLYWPMKQVLTRLEPYALDLWQGDLTDWLPPGFVPQAIQSQYFFGGLYQQLVVTV